MGLAISIAITLLFTAGFYLLDTRTGFAKLSYIKKQVIIGICFGISACIASDLGLLYAGSIVNARDAAPLCAGLIFGGPSGLIAGFIGGIYRLFWGTSLADTFSSQWITTMFSVTANGGLTRIACSLGTFMAGAIGASVRKKLFDDKRPTLLSAFSIGLTAEVLHLLLTFIFRLNYLTLVFELLKVATIPMILGNALTVTAAVLIIKLLSKEKRQKKLVNDLTSAFQMGLLICCLSAFVISIFATFYIQHKLGLKQTEATLQKNLDDLQKKIDIDGGLENFLEDNFTWHVGKSGGLIIGEFLYDENKNPIQIRIRLNGEEYNKGELIDVSAVSDNHVFKMAENFFKSTIHINKRDIPVYGMYELVEDHIIISYVPIEEATIYQNITTIVTAFFIVLVFASIFINIYYLVKKLVLENIQKINSQLAEITCGNLNTVVDVRSHSEFASLSDDINHTVDTLKHYINEAAERIDQELAYAKTIQHAALPSLFPPYPQRKDFDIYASMDTAKEVGGDFYDFYFTGQDRFVFLIADVSGKGIPAAMFMMTSKTFLKSYAENNLPVNEVFNVTNEKLCENNEAGMFVTALMCDIDLKTGMVKFANAGHNPPLVYRKDGSFEFIKPRPGFILAGMEGMQYKLQEIKLNPGDRIYLYTDGVTEAMNEENSLFGEERLLNVLNAHKNSDNEELCKAVKAAIDEFAGGADQFDDITMLGFTYIGTKEVPSVCFDNASIDNLSVITEFAESQMELMDVPMKTVFQVNVVIDEIYSNIAKFAYPNGDGPTKFSISEETDPRRLHIEFEDQGVPYNPLHKEDPDVTLSAEEREIGGLGIYIVKKTMDYMSYRYENDKNILILEKNL